MNAREIIDQLNAYEGDNVWDVVLDLDEYDEVATTQLDPNGASDRIALKDGTVIHYDPQGREWCEYEAE